MTAQLKKWWLSISFLAAYPLIFYVWWWLPDTRIVAVSTLAWAGSASYGIIRARKERYFTSKVELFMYVAVVFDILAEAFCILHPKLGAVHDGHDFWLCAAAFAVVMGCYRFWRLNRELS